LYLGGVAVRWPRLGASGEYWPALYHAIAAALSLAAFSHADPALLQV
jgi:hypothetical protein